MINWKGFFDEDVVPEGTLAMYACTNRETPWYFLGDHANICLLDEKAPNKRLYLDLSTFLDAKDRDSIVLSMLDAHIVHSTTQSGAKKTCHDLFEMLKNDKKMVLFVNSKEDFPDHSRIQKSKAVPKGFVYELRKGKKLGLIVYNSDKTKVSTILKKQSFRRYLVG